MHGVHPNAKAAPTTNGKVKLSLYLLVKIRISLFIKFRLIMPISWSEKNIIIILAIILKILELSKKNFPTKEAVKPKLMNTREKPKLKKIVFMAIKLFFLSTSFSKEEPEI